MEKNLKTNPLDTIIIFFASNLSSLPFNKKFISSSNIFAIIVCFTSTCFFKKLFHFSYNKKLVFSLFESTNLFVLQVFDNKGYNA